MSLKTRIADFRQHAEKHPDFDRAEFLTGVLDDISRRIGELGWTQQRVADEMGVRQSSVARLLRQPANIELKTLFALAYAVGLKLEGRLVDKSTGRFYGDTNRANDPRYQMVIRWRGPLHSPRSAAGIGAVEFAPVEPHGTASPEGKHECLAAAA